MNFQRKKIDFNLIKYALYPVLLSTLLLCGCGVKENSEPPSQSAVEAAVANEVHGEAVTLDRVEHSDRVPKKDTYYYSSSQRDLSFQAESYIRSSNIGIGDGGPYIYSKEIDINYWDAIKKYYEPALTDIFQGGKRIGIRYEYYFRNYEELLPIIERIIEAEKCFAEEKSYHNDIAWLQRKAITSATLRWDTGETNEDGTPIYVSLYPTGYDIFIDSNPEETAAKISSRYAGYILSGDIAPDSTLPPDIMTKGHANRLTDVTINGTKMTDELSYMLNMTPTVPISEVFRAEYSYDYDCYMMLIDPGCGSKTGRCHPLQAIIKAAGGTGGDKCDNRNKEEWTINGNHYVITADRDPGVSFIKGVSLTKNGKPMEITYERRVEYTRSSDMVFISVDDLAEILGLEVIIDEEAGTLIFQ